LEGEGQSLNRIEVPLVLYYYCLICRVEHKQWSEGKHHAPNENR